MVSIFFYKLVQRVQSQMQASYNSAYIVSDQDDSPSLINYRLHL